MNELKQLLSDMKTPAEKIAQDRKLLKLFTNQFSIRMNNGKKYGTSEIMAELKVVGN